MTQDRLDTITAKMNETLPLPVTSEFVGQLVAGWGEISNEQDDSNSYFETKDENIVAAYLAMMLVYYNTK